MASTLFDSSNSSTANLTSGGTFTGTGVSALGVFSIVVMLSCDQVCAVFVDQSGDGTHYDVTDSFVYVPGKPFGIVTQVVGKLYRVRVTNSGSVTTTTLRLETFRQDTSNTLPRTLDSLGNLKTSVQGLYDQDGFPGRFDPQARLAVAEATKLVGEAFTSTVDTNFWTVANSGAGSVANTGATTANYATLTSGTANSGYGSLTSVRQAWFVPNFPLDFHSYVTLTSVAVANSTRAWGAMNLNASTPPGITDGFYFSVNGSGTLSVNAANAGSVTSVASGSFNGNMSQFILDTNQHHYDIILGVFGAYFIIDGVLAHFIKQTTAPLTSTFTLKASAYSENSASGTASATLQVGKLGIARLGLLKNAPKSYQTSAATAATVLKRGPGLLHKLLFGFQTAGGDVALYDNTAASGTLLFDAGTLAKNTNPFFIDFGDTPFFTGLTLVVAAATNPVTVIYE